jgi:predicted nucleic acid-binding protein
LAGEADYLVTQDKDLLVLGTYGKTKIVELPAFWDVLQNLD